MSGGVDSTAAAALLLDAGYSVEGATMQIWQDEDDLCSGTGCCSLSAVDDARLACLQLNIKYHVFNFKDAFSENIIKPFIKEYQNGRTPNPCIVCNKILKFEMFLNRALNLGFDYIATGHYGRVVKEENGEYALHVSKTAEKDQSYALYNLTQEQLKHLLLPVGEYTKPQIREYAEQRKLPVFDKPDSQEICFVKDNDYAGFIEKNTADKPKKGNFIDKNGNILGTHKGIIHYTVGQRKGLGGGFSKPMFVIKVDKNKNEVVIGGNEETFTNTIYANEINIINGEIIPDKFICTAKIRYSAPKQKAEVININERIQINFEKPVRAATPGQSVVLYDGDKVIGGGVIQLTIDN